MRSIRAFCTRHKRTLLVLLFLGAFSLTVVHAVPPASEYYPGDTLDPNCAPGDTNCTVLIFPDQATHAGEYLQTDGTHVLWSAVSGGGSDWSLTGNAGTTPGTNFIGTTDDTPLQFKINNAVAGSIGTIANYNTSFGVLSLPATSTGIKNTGIGGAALGSNTTGVQNTGLGYTANFHNTTGSGNTAIGWAAIGWNSGSGNTAVGNEALNSTVSTVSAGSFNTALGFMALQDNFSHTYNIGIGFNAGNNSTQDNTLYISDNTPHMYYELDSVAGAAPNVIGKDTNGFWHVYDTAPGGGGGGSQDLQSVLDQGNAATSRNIYLNGGDLQVSSTDGTTMYAILGTLQGGPGNIGGTLELKDPYSSNVASLAAAFMSDSRSMSLPDNDGTLALGVTDGSSTVFAGTDGIIDISSLLTGGGSGLTLQHNGSANGSQSLLNLVGGSNVTLTDNGSGAITIDAAGGGGGSESTTASNGLTLSGDDVKLGGTLTGNTTITGGGNAITFTGTGTNTVAISSSATSGTTALSVSSFDNVGSGINAINATTTVFDTSTAVPLRAKLVSSSNLSLTNVKPVLIVERNSTNTTDDGFGGSIDYKLRSPANAFNQSTTTNSLISRITDSVGDTTEFLINGYDNGSTNTLFTLAGNGAAKLNQYGSGTFTGTATHNLAVDASGNIIEVATGGGSGLTLQHNGSANGSQSLLNLIAGTNVAITDDGSGGITIDAAGGGGGGGTVTSLSVASSNGFAGTVANATTTPAITLRTTVTGLLKGNGTAISAATAGTDYQAPITLTTTGSSGAATFSGNTLNIPQYTAGSGTVTSVALTAPTGFSVSGSPVTTSGTLALTTTLSGMLYGTGSGFAAATISSPLSYSAGTLSLTTIPLSLGGLGSVLADPNANKLLGWDDTDNSNGYWTIGNGLSYNHSAHTLNGATFQINGTPNSSQSLLNLIAGSNVTLTDNGSGSVTIDAASGSSCTLGSEEITNGTFTTNATSWILSGFTYDSTNHAIGGSGGAGDTAFQSGALIDGQTYAVTFDVTGASGTTIVVALGDSGDSQVFTSPADGQLTFNGVWSDSGSGEIISFGTSGFTGTIDNVSVTSTSCPASNRVPLIGSTSSNDTETWLGKNAGVLASSDQTVFIGNSAGGQATNANDANFIGYSAGFGATNANNANFFGGNAGYGATAANHGNFFGDQAGGQASSANNSNFFGDQAGFNATTAAHSIFIGDSAGLNDTVDNTAGGTSILIGDNTSTGDNGSGQGYSDSIALGAGATNTDANQFMVGSTASPILEMDIIGTAGQSCTIRPDTLGILCSSDQNLKTNITDLDSALDLVDQIRTVTFNWKNTPDTNPQIGFIAQDLEQYFPTLVSTASNGYLQVNYAGMTPILTKAIQEMDVKVESIENLTNGTDDAPSFADNLRAWFANASNHITRIFTGEICLTDDDGSSECLDKTQLGQLKGLLGDNVTQHIDQSDHTTPDTADVGSDDAASTDDVLPEDAADTPDTADTPNDTPELNPIDSIGGNGDPVPAPTPLHLPVTHDESPAPAADIAPSDTASPEPTSPEAASDDSATASSESAPAASAPDTAQ